MFWIGVLVGFIAGVIGVIVAACLYVSGREDDDDDDVIEEREI